VNKIKVEILPDCKTAIELNPHGKPKPILNPWQSNNEYMSWQTAQKNLCTFDIGYVKNPNTGKHIPMHVFLRHFKLTPQTVFDAEVVAQNKLKLL